MSRLVSPPLYANAFVGRESEVERLTDAVRSGNRLLTLAGTAGIGKTRLAVEFAHASGARSEGRISSSCFVALGYARNAWELCTGLAGAFDVPLHETSTEAAADQLARFLESRRGMLLVLDELEQLISAETANLIATWHSRAPGVTFLITSREPLNIAAESIQRLTSLSVDVEGGEAPAAIRLLRDRVRERGGTNESAGEDGDAAELSIVRSVDGVPLAIELAAARVDALGAPSVAARLRTSLALLSGPNTAAHAGLPTLRASLDRSWELLSAAERSALSRFSVFRGGFDLAAAGAVVGDDAVDLLQALHEKSLVSRTAGRFSFYTCVQAYSAEQLDGSGELEDARQRHVDHFVTYAIHLAKGVNGPDGRAALEQMVRDRDNFFAAVDHARARTKDARFARQFVMLAIHLEPIYWACGPLRAHLHLLDEAYEAALRHGLEPMVRAQTLSARGETHRLAGDLGAAVADQQEAISILPRGDDRALEAMVHASLAKALFSQGDLTGACEVGEAVSRDFAEEDRACGWALAVAAGAHAEAGRAAKSLALSDEALAALRRAGDARGEAVGLILRAVFYLDRRKFELSRKYFEASQVVYDALGLGDRDYIALQHFAVIDHCNGHLAKAFVSYERAVERTREIGHATSEADCMGLWGIACLENEDLEEGRKLIEAACAIAERAGDKRLLALFTAYRAVASAWAGEDDLARELVARARSERSGTDGVLAIATMLQEEHAELCAALAAGDLGDESKIAELRRLVDRLARADSVRDEGSVISYHLLLGARLVERTLRAIERRETAVPATAASLVIHASGEWFDLPTAERVRVDRAHRRLIVELARARCETPGIPRSAESLIEAAWPGERLVARSGSGRLRTSMWRLRRLGLQPFLRSSSEGYWLTSEVLVQIFNDASLSPS